MPYRSRLSDLAFSLALLGAVVSFALVGLALDGNWPKALRVSIAFLGYALCLLPLRRRSTPLPWLPFVVAGAVAGLLSGVVRPDGLHVGRALAQSAAGALLLGPVHWLSLRLHRPLHARIVASGRG